MFRLAKKSEQVILIITRASLITRCCILSGGSRFYLLHFVVLCHEALVADIGEVEAFVDGDVGGVLVGGGVSEALVGVPFLPHVRLSTLLVILLLLLPSSLFVVAPVTRNRIFCYKLTGLTTLVANLLGTGLVVFPLCLRIWRNLLMI